MNINLTKHDVGLILDALESYQLDIEHGNKNGKEIVSFYKGGFMKNIFCRVEVYYIVQNLTYQNKIVAGPYYDRMEAYDVSEKLEKKSSYREPVFKVMSHLLELE